MQISPEALNSSEFMYSLMRELFPICRSITGNGVRETFKIIQKHIPIQVHEVPSGTEVFDWVIPPEWNIKDAWVKNSIGEKIIDFKRSNLHVLNYSVPVSKTVDLDELKAHLHSHPEQPDVIPYVTSYYNRNWGFCLPHKDLTKLPEDKYEVFIDSTLEPGSLTYADILIKGESEKEIFLTTYTCHPSLANNELSGPVLATALAKYFLDRKITPKYSIRLFFGPERIGALAYLHKNLSHLKEKVIGGYVITCVGSPGGFTFIQTREENTLLDRTTMHVLKNSGCDHRILDFTKRASDEIQYNYPGIDIPMGPMMKIRFGEYKEYHNSGDNLDFVNPGALAESFQMYMNCIQALGMNKKYLVQYSPEPMLNKRGLIPKISNLTTKSGRESYNFTKLLTDFLIYCDGKRDVLWIAEKLGISIFDLQLCLEESLKHGLIKEC